jgi:hypothetical protein
MAESVKASRRVMANTVTYMVFDDHEVTDDWNLDQDWVNGTKNPMAQRVIANALAAYWAFQGWGNDPLTFDPGFPTILGSHLDVLAAKGGAPGPAGTLYERVLLDRHWSYVAPTTPQALCIDTRTQREFPAGETVILSGPRTWPTIKRLAERHGLVRGAPLLIVLPTPILPQRMMTSLQARKYPWPAKRYPGDWELYPNNPRQRADLIMFLKRLLDPPALIVFSGDVHHGSVINGLYVHGASKSAIESGKGDWAMRVVQITSSPIKNIKKELREYGNIGESLITQYENRFCTTTKGKSMTVRFDAESLKGPLGHETFIWENHLCVVSIPSTTVGMVHALFIGESGGKPATAQTSVLLDNNPASYRPPAPKLPMAGGF